MQAVLEDTGLRLHMSPTGEVWYADGSHFCGSCADLTHFMAADSWMGKSRVVRVLGLAENAETHPAVVSTAPTPPAGRIEIAEPCETAAERRDPEIGLFRMRQCLVSGSRAAGIL